jgi:hypothetical protein
MSFKIAGKLYSISDTQIIKDTFKKREFIVLYNENPGEAYSKDQYLKFEATQDKCNLLDNFSEGDTVEVFFNLYGREWVSPKGEKVYFNTLNAWRIEKADASHPPQSYSAPYLNESDSQFGNANDDLPF